MLVEREADIVRREDCIESKKFIKIGKEAVCNDEMTAKENRDRTERIREEGEEDKDCSKDDERDCVDSAETMRVCFD